MKGHRRYVVMRILVTAFANIDEDRPVGKRQ